MYKKVVVPLDGSKLAEVTLPHLQEIAKSGSPEILLVSVTEEMKGQTTKTLTIEDTSAREFHMVPEKRPTLVSPIPLSTIYSLGIDPINPSTNAQIPASLGRMGKTAFDYLVKVARKLEKEGIAIKISVLVGNPAEEIVRFAKEEKADLILMASRGKSGFNRWDMGNVADKVIRATDVPVMLVKPKPGFKETKPRRRGKAT